MALKSAAVGGDFTQQATVVNQFKVQSNGWKQCLKLSTVKPKATCANPQRQPEAVWPQSFFIAVVSFHLVELDLV